MKTENYYWQQLRKFGRFCSKLFKDFVSGIPGDEELIKTGISEFKPLNRVRFTSKMGASVHHPVSRPKFKKMTLSKEKKKEKSH